jgi:protein-tyrosine-phosphatase
MAAAIAADLMRGHSIKSAGVAAFDGEPASLNAVACMEKNGLSLSNHYAKTINEESADWAGLILTMTDSHKRKVAGLFPRVIEKLFTITEFVGESHDIIDPYGMDLETYEQCADELRRLIQAVAEKL